MSTQENRPWKPASQPPYHGKLVEVLSVESTNASRQRRAFYDRKRDQWFASKAAKLQNRCTIVASWRELPPR